MEPLGPGLWRGKVLRHRVWLVSGIDLPVEPDSVPLHLVGKEPLATEREVAQLLAEDEKLQWLYGGWMSVLHPTAWEEVEEMARRTGRGLTIDWRPAIKAGHLKEIVRQAGAKRLLQQFDARELVEFIGENEELRRETLDSLLRELSPAERRELKRRLE
jgi:hypothetical protein